MKKAMVLGVVVLFLAVGTAGADTVSYVNSPLYNTDSLTGFATTGSMMDGMSVTAYFLGGGSQTLPWATTGADSGGVSGTGWSLLLSGDTFSANWTLSTAVGANIALTGLYIDAKPGQTVFDVVSGSTMTPGSELGWPFSRTNPVSDLFVVNATYAGPLGVGGNPPEGDLFTTLDLAFVAPTGGAYGFTGSMTFRADTDNATTQIVTAPEPVSLIFLGFGLLGLAGLRRRIRK